MTPTELLPDAEESAPDLEQRARHLMMAALDGEISPEQRRHLDKLLHEHAHLAAEWHQFKHLKEVTRMTRLAQPPDAAFTGYWQSVYHRLERGFAWILVSVGAMVVGAWGLWQMVQDLLADTTTPAPVKIGLFALLLGVLILGISVAREKWSVRRYDPFEEVEK